MPEFITRYFAQIVPDCDPTTTCDTNALLQLIVNILQFLIDTALIVAVVSIMWGGLLMLTSGGSSSKITNAKKAITAAVTGIIIVTVAATLISIFIGLFTSCEFHWWDFKNALICGTS